MRAVLDVIKIVKVNNGYVINVGEESYVAYDVAGVEEIIKGETPKLLETLEKRQKEEPKNAIPEPERTEESPSPNTATELSEAR